MTNEGVFPDEAGVSYYQSLLLPQKEEGRISRENPGPSYAYRAKDGPKELLIYGFSHTYNTGQYAPVAEALLTFKPQLVLVEGGGDWSETFAGRTGEEIMKDRGEQAYISWLAHEQGAEVRTWDLSGDGLFQVAIDKNSPDEVIGWIIGSTVRHLYDADKPRTRAEFDHQVGLSSRAQTFSKKYGIDLSWDSLERVAQMYTGQTIEEMDKRAAYDLCDPVKDTPGSKVARDMTEPRDRKAIEVLVGEKESYDRVMATCGRNHAIRWEKSVAEIYGPTERI